jgi:hypothetical protein
MERGRVHAKTIAENLMRPHTVWNKINYVSIQNIYFIVKGKKGKAIHVTGLGGP